MTAQARVQATSASGAMLTLLGFPWIVSPAFFPYNPSGDGVRRQPPRLLGRAVADDPYLAGFSLGWGV
jgi:hypothetical protein